MKTRGVVAVATVVAGLGVAGCGGQSPAPVAKGYLAAWSRSDLDTAGRRTDNPSAATTALTATTQSLRIPKGGLNVALGRVSTHGDNATAAFRATMVSRGLGTWRYSGQLQLRHAQGKWQVHWTPADIYPGLTAATHLAVVRQLPPRAPLLDDQGKPIFAERAVVQVGIEPARLRGDRSRTIATVAAAVGVHDVGGLTKAVQAAAPHAFVPVITLRRAAYEKVKPKIYNLPGTVFISGSELLPPTTGFGQALLGTIGPATADVLTAAGTDYVAGDVLGLSGLQAAYQHRLAGTPGGSIVIADRIGSTLATLATFAPHPGTAVSTTIDTRVQLAAEKALAHETKPAALVAVRASDGAILAVANTPDATSYDRALEGHYPPGSTFKVVTTYALLARDVTPTTPVPCRPTITVDGKPFRNFEGEASATATFATDFAKSCNTAFIGASARLTDTDLGAAAGDLGIMAPWHLPVPAYSGSVPLPTSPVVKAADAIGQGDVTVSPLAMAMVAAAIESGVVRAPTLVSSPTQQSTAPTSPLDAGRVAALHRLMRLVVTSGTAADAGLPAGTYGKTGTAEFGNDDPPHTHAWFLGFRGDLAFVVLVEGGGVGGAVAAPLAATFLRDVPPTVR